MQIRHPLWTIFKISIKKMAIILAGLLVSFLLFELFLRLVGFKYYQNKENHTQHESNKLHKAIQENHYRILCLGASFTAGSGAPEGESYPDHLERILRKNHTRPISVFNDAIPEKNSYQVYSRLQKRIKTYSPHLVILQTGEPNFWNMYGYSQYVENQTSWGNDFIYKLKIYNFYEYLKKMYSSRYERSSFNEEINIEIKNATPPADFTDLDELETKIFSQITTHDYFPNLPHTKESDDYYRKVIQAFKYLSQKNPLMSLYVARIYHYYFKEIIPATKWYIWGLENIEYKDDRQYEPENINDLKSIKNAYSYDKNVMELINDFDKRLAKAGSLYAYTLENVSQNKIADWIESDTLKIKKLVEKEHGTLLLLNYPPPMAPYSYPSEVIRNIAQKHKILFVDNEKELNQIFQNKNVDKLSYYFQKWGIVDNHPNSMGYKQTAEYISHFLKEKNLINF